MYCNYIICKTFLLILYYFLLGNKSVSDVSSSQTASALGQFVMATATPFLGNAIHEDADDNWVSIKVVGYKQFIFLI